MIILNEDNMLLEDKMMFSSSPKIYPFAMVLRLRVLQVGNTILKNYTNLHQGWSLTSIIICNG